MMEKPFNTHTEEAEEKQPVRKPMSFLRKAANAGVLAGSFLGAGYHMGEKTGKEEGLREAVENSAVKESYDAEIAKEIEVLKSDREKIREEMNAFSRLFKKYQGFRPDTETIQKLNAGGLLGQGLTNEQAGMMWDRVLFSLRYLHDIPESFSVKMNEQKDFIDAPQTQRERTDLTETRKQIAVTTKILGDYAKLASEIKEQDGYKIVEVLEKK